jgi:hypothetical protein
MMSHTSQNGASDPTSTKSRDMMKTHRCSGQIKSPSSCTRVRNKSQMSRLLFKQSAAVSHALHRDRSRLVLQLRNYHTVIETRRPGSVGGGWKHLVDAATRPHGDSSAIRAASASACLVGCSQSAPVSSRSIATCEGR